jgi:hypothetical protein
MTDVLLHLSEVLSEPLHAQIPRQIRAKLLAQELADNQPLPSIHARRSASPRSGAARPVVSGRPTRHPALMLVQE